MHLRCGRRYTEVMAARVRQLTVFLVIGAVINVALAMGFIWFEKLAGSAERWFVFDQVVYAEYEGAGLTLLTWHPCESSETDEEPRPGPRWSRLHSLERPLPNAETYGLDPERIEHWEFAAGWPMRSMSFEIDFFHPEPGFWDYTTRNGIDLPWRTKTNWAWQPWQPRAFPLRIIPAGFLINTMVYSVVAAGLWVTLVRARRGETTIRRALRRRHARCEGCGYPRVGLAPDSRCPECGTRAS
jgi:hypothetical protein